MDGRLRLPRIFTAVLYLGPLLAGLIGQGWAMVPWFAALFVVAGMILQPQMWPRSPDDMAKSEAVVALAALVATQVLLVVVLFAVGRGIGGVMGMQPAVPPYLPLALSFVAVPLSRLVWTEHGAAPPVQFDPAVHKAAPRPVTAGASAMLPHLMALGDDVAEDVVQQHLSAISDHLDPVLVRTTLAEALANGQATVAGIKALIVHATDPAISTLMAGTAYPAQGFAAAGHDPDLLTLFARRCVIALEDEPDLVPDCPGLSVVEEMAQRMQEPARTALNRLAGLIAQGQGDRGRVSLTDDMR